LEVEEEALSGAQEPEQDLSEPVEDAPIESGSEQADEPADEEPTAESDDEPEEEESEEAPVEEAEEPADEEPTAESDDEPEEEESEEAPVEEAEEPADEEPTAESDDEPEPEEEESEETPDEQPIEEAEEPTDEASEEEPADESDDKPEPEEEESEETPDEPPIEEAEEPADEELAAEGEIDELADEEPEVVVELPPEPDDDRAWHVVHCYSGYEHKVKHNLEQRIETMHMQDRIFQVVIPTEEEIEVKDGKRRTIERRVFPGYILVQMLMDDDSWYVVRNTPGVTGFVGMGNRPAPLRPEEVQAIMKRMEAEAPRIKVTYRSGQKVRIIDGPFNEFIGVVDEIDMERAKVRVLVSFFGRDTPVELDFLQVEKI
jgi:transcriptional antiterminator NusG